MPTNTKRADMESAPTANNVILIHTVGVDVLDDPLQRDVTFVSNAGSFRRHTPPPSSRRKAIVTVTIWLRTNDIMPTNSVGADSISAFLVFREHIECSPTTMWSKSRDDIATRKRYFHLKLRRGRRPRRPASKECNIRFKRGLLPSAYAATFLPEEGNCNRDDMATHE